MRSKVAEFIGTHLGQKEIQGHAHNPFIVGLFSILGANWYKSDETAWCGALVGAAVLNAKPSFKFPRANYYMVTAEKWRHVGKKIALQDAQPYDIVVTKRNGGSGYHVTFFSEITNTRTVRCVGGNQSNELKYSNYKTSDVACVIDLDSL